MPIVECTCGEKILLIPDLAAMSKAINNHKAEHNCANEQVLIKKIFNFPRRTGASLSLAVLSAASVQLSQDTNCVVKKISARTEKAF